MPHGLQKRAPQAKALATARLLAPRRAGRSGLSLQQGHPLRFHGAQRLVPALVALEDANFGAVSLDLIRGAASQMSIAAALAAADRSNKFLILDDEGTPFHCPARN